MAALPAEVPLSFDLQWSGTDLVGGSGLSSFEVHVAQDGPPWSGFTPWLSTTDTMTTFTGQRGGTTYAFYSLARDNAGNVEAPPAVADATTTIAVQVPFAPAVGTATATTIRLLDVGLANVDTVEHAIFVEEAGVGLYVGADGRLQAAPQWLSGNQWADVLIWPVLPQTQYAITTRARSAGATETAFGPPTTIMTSIQADANGDAQITVLDKLLVEAAFGSNTTRPNWDPRADLNGDARVTTQDRRIVQLAMADNNRDGNVDLEDFADFLECATGAGGTMASVACVNFDTDGDGDIDSEDYADFYGVLSGP